MNHIPADGQPLHPHGDLRDRLLDPVALDRRQARADRLLMAHGAGHLVHDLPIRADGRIAAVTSRPWRLDPIPVVLGAATFRWLSLAVAERMEALDAVIADLYGEQTLVQERIVPAAALGSTERFRVNAVGSRPRRWLTTYAVDVALGADGAWYVVQDITDVPAGVGYALLDRSVMSRLVPEIMAEADIASMSRYPVAIRRSLAAASPADSPRIVVFSAGLDHPSYVDHSYLAVQLGLNLVEGADLVVRQRRLWLRTLDGLEAVDVLYRRVDDPMVDPLEVAARGSVGVPGLLQAVRSGGAVMANAHGSGVTEAPEIAPFLTDACARLRPMEQALAPLPHPYHPLAMAPLAPGSLAGQAEASVVVRMFAVDDGETVVVMPGGTGRVVAPGDDPREPTACLAKDVWVLGQTVAPVVGARLPQVNLGRSVPTRAADALYWTNRAAERAEAMARTMRVVGSRLEQDPGLLSMHGGAWTSRMIRVTSGIRRNGIWSFDPGLDALQAELSALGDAVANEIGSLLTEATTVREFLSVTTGRVLSHLAELRTSLQAHSTVVDDLDAVLADFAALAGLWRESTVRGPAWRIGDTGRRLERCLVTLDLIEGIFEPAPSGTDVDDDVAMSVLEVLLAGSESLVAYRRRYRSEIETEPALDLVVHDEANPRSLAASIGSLAEHAANGEISINPAVISDARRALGLPVAELVPTLRGIIVDAGASVVSEWFSTPVDPIIMRPTGDGW
ncbi:circularly permuted type 2 ATP-grasp protein [Ilumatobacter sp.]|uniref:circularly permuted type 2 ATP-grasp protein n=1 Tax=Ilumatobacter sp. TaxID=1967498 RepID=UPI003AF53B91